LNSKINNTKIPLASYKKKQSYGYGSLIIDGSFKVENYMVKALKDKNSQIVIDNQKFKKVSSNPLDIVYKKNIALLNKIK